MSAPVDVLAVFARAEGQARMVAGLAGDPRARQLLKDLASARAAVAELIEADAEYDKCRADLRDLRVHLGHNNPLHHETPHLLRYEASVKRRSAALARVKGGAA